MTVAGRSGTIGQFGSFNLLTARLQGFDETTNFNSGSAGQSSRRTSTAVRGTAAVVITDIGRVAGTARATAHGGTIISSAGRVTGALIAAARGRSTTTSLDSTFGTSVVPTSGDPVRRTTETSTRTVTSGATDGNIAAFYGGTIGIASPGNVFPVPSVSLSAQGSSEATIAGTMFGNFSSITGATNTDGTVTSTTVTVVGSTTGSHNSSVTSASTVMVTGQVRNVGRAPVPVPVLACLRRARASTRPRPWARCV